MNEKTKSTIQKFIDSLSPKELKKYKEERQEFILSELILAVIEKDKHRLNQMIKAFLCK